MKGNIEFKNGEYCESIISYSKALKICPLIYTNDRSILFANRAASKHKLVSYFSKCISIKNLKGYLGFYLSAFLLLYYRAGKSLQLKIALRQLN